MEARKPPEEPPVPGDFANWPPELQDAYQTAPVDCKRALLSALAWSAPTVLPLDTALGSRKVPLKAGAPSLASQTAALAPHTVALVAISACWGTGAPRVALQTAKQKVTWPESLLVEILVRQSTPHTHPTPISPFCHECAKDR